MHSTEACHSLRLFLVRRAERPPRRVCFRDDRREDGVQGAETLDVCELLVLRFIYRQEHAIQHLQNVHRVSTFEQQQLYKELCQGALLCLGSAAAHAATPCASSSRAHLPLPYYHPHPASPASPCLPCLPCSAPPPAPACTSSPSGSACCSRPPPLSSQLPLSRTRPAQPPPGARASQPAAAAAPPPAPQSCVGAPPPAWPSPAPPPAVSPCAMPAPAAPET